MSFGSIVNTLIQLVSSREHKEITFNDVPHGTNGYRGQDTSYPNRHTAQPHVAVIESIATGTPDGMRRQSDTADMVTALFDSKPEQQNRIQRLYKKTQINKRHMAVDPLHPDFDRKMTIRQRMDLFLEYAVPLATEVCSRALAQTPREEIGMLVLVTSTGFVAPGVDVAIINKLGLSKDISRAAVSFMGCAAAMNGLRAASDFARAHPGSKALVCCIELSSVNAVYDDNINDVIISSLFADGCAAMVVGSSSLTVGQDFPKPSAVVIRDHFHQVVDGTTDGIILGINHNGITCELSPKLPSYIYSGLEPIIRTVLGRHKMGINDIDLWAIHPGGPKIIDESVRSLKLDSKVAAMSWDVLSNFGNMLSASLPFVLERMVAAKQQEKTTHNSTGLAFSFAPGISVEGVLFEIVGD